MRAHNIALNAITCKPDQPTPSVALVENCRKNQESCQRKIEELNQSVEAGGLASFAIYSMGAARCRAGKKEPIPMAKKPETPDETLELLVDAHSLGDIIDRLANIAADKADHIQTNYSPAQTSDDPQAAKWSDAARLLTNLDIKV